MIYRNIVRKLFSKVYTKEHEWLSKISDKHYKIGSKTPPTLPQFLQNQKFLQIFTFSQKCIIFQESLITLNPNWAKSST
jgi:hypothetical protein